MSAQIPDGGFETGAGWSFTGTGDIETGFRQIGFGGNSPHDGTHMAVLQAWTGDGVTAASVERDVPVALGDEGYYFLNGVMCGGPDGFWDVILGRLFIDITFDGLPWITDDFVPLATTGHTWYPLFFGTDLGLMSIYWAPGTHRLKITAHSPHADIFGGAYSDTMRQIVLLDSLSLEPRTSGIVLAGTPPPVPEVLRLTHAPGGGTQKWTVPAGRTARIMYHG